PPTTFTRRDLTRFGIAAAILIGALTAIFALDLIPQKLDIAAGDVAGADIVAPRTQSYVSQVLPTQAKDAASSAVAPGYDYDEPNAVALAADQVAACQQAVAPVDAAFAPDTKEALRKSVLESSFTLSPDARATLVKITAERWKDVRAEASRVLAATESK